MYTDLFDIVIIFSLYSFGGWVLETVYASIREKRFVNRGFLSGPFVPIYGFGALLVIFSSRIADNILGAGTMYSLPVKFFLAFLLASFLEYLVSLAMEKIFGCRWWDYSENFLNIQGRVCLSYSLLWGLLACLLVEVVHPVSLSLLEVVNPAGKAALVAMLVVYFVFDTVNSANEIINLRQVLAAHYLRPAGQVRDKLLLYRRIILAFPGIRFQQLGVINQEIRGFLNGKVEKIKAQIKFRWI
ncbi:hypothetical protein BR63_00895 [Thermanaerosceptrum fracticalcis]|uniref:ABC transporter permease n=1 Tax=Thermanaerosceptrum fracticalcis TaxID=1712410 RepID=A0A7G6DYU9_THEFR|nr:putative ABC transporter permease [Thermanaerosceptrum fracticalcis]QNB45003.1 hypothetical protein BR63_00895 [Thermanaerosceptrum fracticalcis]